MINVLLIEDDIKIRRYLEIELKMEGYNVDSAADGEIGFFKAKNKLYDIILLDLMLPKISGEELCYEFRKFLKTPIIILTAKDEILTKVSLLDLGADDYITKPFVIEELLARIRVSLRHKSKDFNSEFLIYGDIKIDLNQKVIFIKNAPLQLTKTEYNLLHYLVLNNSIILSREQIVTNVWGNDYLGDEKIVDAFIKTLRKKIEVDYIKTVRGFGYTLQKD